MYMQVGTWCPGLEMLHSRCAACVRSGMGFLRGRLVRQCSFGRFAAGRVVRQTHGYAHLFPWVRSYATIILKRQQAVAWGKHALPELTVFLVNSILVR